MNLQQIMTDLEQMLKANADAEAELLVKADADDKQDDEDIKAMADGDADDDGEPDSEDATDDNDEKPFAKSFAVTLEDGEEVEALDAEEFMKALDARFDQMTKALGASTSMIKALSVKNAALQQRIEVLAKSGRGRKSTLNVHEKNVAGQPTESKVEPRAILAKALDAQRAGKITSAEVSELDVYLGRGLSVPENLLAKIG